MQDNRGLLRWSQMRASPIVPIAYVLEHTMRPHSSALALGVPSEAGVTDTGHREVVIW